MSVESPHFALTRLKPQLSHFLPVLLQDPDFPSLSGARVVRIAVHPQLSGAGYGTRAVQQLKRYFQGQLLKLDEDELPDGLDTQQQPARNGTAAAAGGGGGDGSSMLLTEQVKPRQGLPPLLVNLGER